MASTSCNSSLDKSELERALVIMSSTGGASVLVCSVAVVLVVVFKLYKQFAYRLALYQVLAAMAFGVACAVEAIFVNYDSNPETYSRACQGIASVFFCLEWVKLMFTNCVTFHLFCFAVLHKNFKRLEPVYIISSLALPAAFASVPYMTSSYGRSGAWCWIQDWKNNCPSEILEAGNVETFALWYGPAFCLLLVDSIAMVAMGVVLGCRARHRGDVSRDSLLLSAMSTNKAHKSALNQLLPLLAYPVIFFVFILGMFSYRLYNSQPRPPNYLLLKATAVLAPGVGLTAGVVLLAHIAVAKCKTRGAGGGGWWRMKSMTPTAQKAGDSFTTYKPEQTSTSCSVTRYSQQRESEVDLTLSVPDRKPFVV
ncbi:hypothetical protein EMCRGX_G002571 [Ephydatia muelleri]|eukprot:Em0001g2410a